MDSRADIYSLTLAELEHVIAQEWGFPKYRAKQVFGWLYKDIHSFDEMGNVPKDLRTKLAKNFWFSSLEVINTLTSPDETEKYLVKCLDGHMIEVVKMEYHHGVSACISTQVGCKMHCKFCASGSDGFFRNLTAGEMVEQILLIQQQTQKRVGNVVLMGSGEPLDNFVEVRRFFELVHMKEGLNIGYRHLTLSTCGIVPKIAELAELDLSITLAISLHAPIDELRDQLVPVNRRYPLAELIPAARAYAEKTKRRVTFEYSLIAGVNDSPQMADKLADLLQNWLCHVNLIPVNPTENARLSDNGALELVPPQTEALHRFQAQLEKRGVPATIRRTLGDNIQAACGQLKCSYLDAGK